MKVLVTGATGFLGSFIVRSVLKNGHQVRALVRATSKRANLDGLAVEWAVGDILEPKTLDAAMQGCDAVIHAAALVSFRWVDRHKIQRINVDGAENVFAAAKRNAIKRVVYASSVATMGASTKPEVLDETAPWGQKETGNPYHLAKWAAEQRALEYVRDGLPIVMLCPGLILGPDDVNLTSTRLVLHFLNRAIPGFVEGGFSVVHVRDCGDAFAAALEKGEGGERYILAGLNTSLSNFFGTLSQVTGVPAPKLLPRFLPYTLATLCDFLVFAVPPLGHTRIGELNRPTIRASMQYTFYDPSKAQRALGFKLTPLEATLRETVESLKARGLVSRPRT